ncbi:MAG: hypothetical protein GY851_20255 [bacterium]|nr:hypothetical protein [bacterium]
MMRESEMHSDESEDKPRRPSEFVRFVVVSKEGAVHDIVPEDFDDCPLWADNDPAHARLRQFVANEFGLSKRAGLGLKAPKHIEYMRRQELLNYCEVSEKGHYQWYPKGVLIQRLILDYAADLAREWGAFEMKNPIVIRGDHNAVGELMGEFHERDYRVDGGRGVCYLRYASDPLAFPFMQQVHFSHRQAPLKVYEEASCFRNEQEGEVSGLKRVRNFLMTDMHAACVDEAQARAEFEALCVRFGALMDSVIAQGRWVLGWEGTVAFFEANREWLVALGARMGVPAFFKLMPRMSHYYAMKNEYQFITEDGANIQVSTVQWDVKDGERFDIGHVDSDGIKRPCPVILHASSFGSIERTLCAILENVAYDAAHGLRPMLPYWLSPTQVRVLPVADAYVEEACALCDRLAAANIRADVDDRPDTVGKKIRNGETEWVPYLVVFGEREAESGQLAVRCRESGGQLSVSVEALMGTLRDEQGGLPYRPLPLPVRVSRRPVFFG